jgi:hypothetical protein
MSETTLAREVQAALTLLVLAHIFANGEVIVLAG